MSLADLQEIGIPLGEGQAEARKRMRWNSNVLGLLAHHMGGVPGAPAISVAPHDAGVHLRWRFDPRRGWPTDGFYLYRRPIKGHWTSPRCDVDLRELPATGPLHSNKVKYFGTKTVEFLHASGCAVRPGEGMVVPPASTLTIKFPVSMRQVTLRFSTSLGVVAVEGYHGHQLTFHGHTDAGALDSPICHEMVDEIRITVPLGVSIAKLESVPVILDLAGWQPLGRIPPIGSGHYSPAGILDRLPVDVEMPPEEREEEIRRLIVEINRGATAGTSIFAAQDFPAADKLKIEAPVLVDMMSLRPQVAWAFGLYAVDPAPPVVPADYMVVASWQSPRNDVPAAGVALFRPDAAPPAPAGLPLGALLDGLIGNPGLLYFAPVFHVDQGRALAPVAPAIPTFVLDDQVRRQLDPTNGKAHIELEVGAKWGLALPSYPPALARQIPALAAVEIKVDGASQGEELGPPKLEAGTCNASDLLSIPIESLPTTANVTVTSVDLFGVKSSSAVSTQKVLPADLYPLPPPPASFTGRLEESNGGVKLHAEWVWGGRSSLFHPNARGFEIEWVDDTQLPGGCGRDALDASGAWRALSRVQPLGARSVTIDWVGNSIALESSKVHLAHLNRKGAVAGDLFVGVKTSLWLAQTASGRLNGSFVRFADFAYTVTHHTIGPNVILYFVLPGGITAGTPFEGKPIDGTDLTEFPATLELTIVPDGQRTTTVTVSETAAAIAAVKPGTLLTQAVNVFTVLGRSRTPRLQAILQTAFKPQEPGAAEAGRILPALGNASAAAIQESVQALLATAPTRDRPVRRVFIRARTVDHLDRRGEPSTPIETQWVRKFPDVPSASPTVVRGSPTDRLGKCRLQVTFDKTLANCGVQLERATDAQIRETWNRWLRRRQQSPDPGWRFDGLSDPFAWPPGISEAEQVKDPISDFGPDTDSMRVFIEKLKATNPNASAPSQRVFDEAFDLRGRMWRAEDCTKFTAETDGATLEFEDVGERAGNVYFYRAKLVDAADRVGDPLGISLPGRGYDISQPAAPELIAPFVMADKLLLRWKASADPRVTGYRVTRHPLWAGGPPDDTHEAGNDAFKSFLRVEGRKVALPGILPGVSVTDVKVGNATVFAEGALSAKEQAFRLWYADGNRAALVLTAAGGRSIRDTIDAEYNGGVADGTTAYLEPLTIAAGVVDTSFVKDGVAALDATLLAASGAVDVTNLGFWHDVSFLTVQRVEEGTALVLQITTSTKSGNVFVTRTVGRCPAAPAIPTLAVTRGVVELDMLQPDERVTGVYLASAVTLATADGQPDPERSGATSLMSSVRIYEEGFVRRLRDHVPMVFKFTTLAGMSSRFVGQRRTIVFADGSANIPCWDASVETLTGVFERSVLTIEDGNVTGADSATNLLSHVLTEPQLGRITQLLPDGTGVRANSADGATSVSGRPIPLVWERGRLYFGDLRSAHAFNVDAVYGASVQVDGSTKADTTRNWYDSVTIGDSALVPTSPLAEGTVVTARYRGDNMVGPPNEWDQSHDPRRREEKYGLTTDHIGRRWRFSVEALCDFPPHIGKVFSEAAIVEVEVQPPASSRVTIESAVRLGTGELEIRVTASSGLKCTITAIREGGADQILERDFSGGTIRKSIDVDGVSLPTEEALIVKVVGRYPNLEARTFTAEKEVAARDSGGDE